MKLKTPNSNPQITEFQQAATLKAIVDDDPRIVMAYVRNRGPKVIISPSDFSLMYLECVIYQEGTLCISSYITKEEDIENLQPTSNCIYVRSKHGNYTVRITEKHGKVTFINLDPQLNSAMAKIAKVFEDGLKKQLSMVKPMLKD